MLLPSTIRLEVELNYFKQHKEFVFDQQYKYSKPNRTEPLPIILNVESFLIFSGCPDMTVIEDNYDQYHLE